MSHLNILNNGLLLGERMAITDKDRICIPVPLYHCFGMVLGGLCAVNRGAAMVYPCEGFDAIKTLESVS